MPNFDPSEQESRNKPKFDLAAEAAKAAPSAKKLEAALPGVDETLAKIDQTLTEVEADRKLDVDVFGSPEKMQASLERIEGELAGMREDHSRLSRELMAASELGKNEEIQELSDKIEKLAERIRVATEQADKQRKWLIEAKRQDPRGATREEIDAALEPLNQHIQKGGWTRVKKGEKPLEQAGDEEIDAAVKTFGKEDAEEVIEVTDDMIVSETERPPRPSPSREKPAERKPETAKPWTAASAEAELRTVDQEIRDLQGGTLLTNPETGQREQVLGLNSLEKTLTQQYGVNFEKRALSGTTRFWDGLRSLFRPNMRRKLGEHRRRSGQITDAMNRKGEVLKKLGRAPKQEKR